MIEFVVGAGGKTSYIHQRAREALAQGHRVLVCTSTHMLREADTLLPATAAQIGERLDACGYCMAGSPATPEKIGPLPPALYQEACGLADLVLVEADGSRRHPIKACRENEPVIYPNAGSITVVMGMQALGQTFDEAAFRLEQVCQLLAVSPQDRIAPAHLAALLQKAYLEPLSRQYPGIPVRVRCTGQTLFQRAVGAMLEAGQDPALLEPAWFSPKPVLFLCGGGHVSLALARMAAIADLEVVVMDDRPEFADPQRFPMARQVICDDFANLHRYAQPHGYYVIVTNGHTADSLCARQLFPLETAYLGMIGSRAKVARTREALGELWDDRIFAPVGLSIGASTPAEIAVSILAQIIQVKNAAPHSSASRELLEAADGGVLCILTEKRGSTPRGVGAMMLVTPDRVIDTIGGGILEQQVIQRARTLDRVTREQVVLNDIGMACTGSNTVLYLPLRQR